MILRGECSSFAQLMRALAKRDNMDKWEVVTEICAEEVMMEGDLSGRT